MIRQQIFRLFDLRVCIALVAMCSVGCAEGQGGLRLTKGPRGESGSIVSREELRERLDQFYDVFSTTIQRAGDQLIELRTSRRAHRLTLLWQMRILPMARNALDQDDVLHGFLDLWTLCLRQQYYLTEGEGRKLFGKDQQIAIDAANECEKEMESVAGLIMARDMVDRAAERVRKLAAENPLRGEFSGVGVHTKHAEAQQDEVLKGILTIPLAPFRWLGGVDETAQAIKGFTAVADRLTDIVRGFTADARLQAELFVLEVEELRSVKSALHSFNRLSKSSERLAITADAFPPRLREEFGGMLDDLDRDRPGVNKTLESTRSIVDQLEPTGKSVSAAGDSLAGAAKAIEDMVASFRTPTADPMALDGDTNLPTTAPARAGRPFDVTEYGDAADSVSKAAKELQVVIADLRGLAADESLVQRVERITKGVEEVVGRSQLQVNQMTDHAFWRLVQVVLLVLLIVVIYKLATTRWGLFAPVKRP